MKKASVIAIDGPAGSGKSTLGLELAQRLGYMYFDTGVLYRAVTLLTLREHIDPADEGAVVALAERWAIDVLPPTVADGRQYTVIANGADITWQIREPAVDHNVSVVSAHPGLRRALLSVQREIACRGRIVMVGRDIGTVVVPEADLKIFLNASLATRAERRYRELLARGYAVTVCEVQEEVRKRDELDSHRAMAPLRAAPEAHVVQTDYLTIAEEADLVEALACHWGDKKSDVVL
ncbi:MAG: (d)CMP kinase [Chloroflexota bacterium]